MACLLTLAVGLEAAMAKRLSESEFSEFICNIMLFMISSGGLSVWNGGTQPSSFLSPSRLAGLDVHCKGEEKTAFPCSLLK
jgi:hypothetical protein